jgi:hypothetical protein
MPILSKNIYLCFVASIGSKFRFSNQLASEVFFGGFFLKGFIRPLTFVVRLLIKRMPPKFQYLRQASESNDVTVSTFDLPTKNLLSDNAFKGYAGKETFGIEKGQSELTN